MNLNGRSVWLVGGSRGIGEAVAVELSKRGARLAITARPSPELSKLTERLSSSGKIAFEMPADVGSQEQLQGAAREATAKLGEIDMVIANVGIYSETWPENFNVPEYLSIMDINYGGLVRTIQAVLPQMLERGNGTIVGTASVAGYRGLPRAAAYAASKSAIITFLESIRFHLRDRGIKVVVVNPGFVLSRLTKENEFFMPGFLKTETAATYICDGLEKGKDKIAFPPAFAAFLAFSRIVPFKIYDLAVKQIWKKLKHPKPRTIIQTAR